MSNGADYNTNCRNGCGTTIIMSQRSGKWAPYEQDGTFHNCPKRQKEPQAQTPTNGQQQMAPAQNQNVQQQQQQLGNKVPRTSTSVTLCFEGPDLAVVCAQHQNFVNAARDYGANVYGSSFTFAEGKGTYAMVVWLDMPKTNVQYVLPPS